MFTFSELCVESSHKCQNLGDMLLISEALLKCFEKWKMEVSINLPENHSQFWVFFFRSWRNLEMGRKSLNVFSLTVWNVVFHVAIINSEMPYYLIWLKKLTSYMQWVFCLKDLFLQQLLITVHDSWHTILVLLSWEAKYWKLLFEGSVHNLSVWIKSRMLVWIFLQKVDLPMFNGSGTITQAMSPKSS